MCNAGLTHSLLGSFISFFYLFICGNWLCQLFFFCAETDTICLNRHPDSVANVPRYSLVFKLQTTVDLAQLCVDDSPSLGVIQWMATETVFIFLSFWRCEFVFRLLSWAETSLLVLYLTQLKVIFRKWRKLQNEFMQHCPHKKKKKRNCRVPNDCWCNYINLGAYDDSAISRVFAVVWQNITNLKTEDKSDTNRLVI